MRMDLRDSSWQARRAKLKLRSAVNSRPPSALHRSNGIMFASSRRPGPRTNSTFITTGRFRACGHSDPARPSPVRFGSRPADVDLFLAEHFLLGNLRNNVADQDMRFLNTWRFLGRYAKAIGRDVLQHVAVNSRHAHR